MKQPIFYIFAIILFANLSACGSSPEELAANSAADTATAASQAPRSTDLMTMIPTATSTPTATITLTATPTNTPTPQLVECIDFENQQVEVYQVGKKWKILVDQITLLDFYNNEEMEARQALIIIQYYQMNRQCFVGLPDPGMIYYLVDGEAPAGYIAGEDCIYFNPNLIAAKKFGKTWKITEDGHFILDFGASEVEARTALALIKQYGFTRTCYIGRPAASMIYWRR